MKTPIKRNATANISISLPKEVRDMALEYARKRDITFSQTVKEAIKSYVVLNEMQDLQKTFRPLAKKLGIKSDEDVEKIFG